MRVVLHIVVAFATVRAVAAQPADDLDVPAAEAGSAAPAPAPTAPTPPNAVTPPVETPAPTPAPQSVTPAPDPVTKPSTVKVTPTVPPATSSLASLVGSANFDLTAYVQAQGQVDQQSQDQLLQGGAQLNQDGFVVRRARILVGKRWRAAGLAIELDANTVRGATVGLRRAEASLFVPGPPDVLPTAALTVGLTDIPFGFELVESSRQRLFMERSIASIAFFPGEADIGARAWGAYHQFRYAVAVLAGEPISERAGTNRADPNQAKDLVGRVGVETAPHRRLAISSGVSVLLGRGFHAGTDATKDTIDWHDLNENGAIELGELMSIPGIAATPSENFDRWALGADLEVAIRTGIGWTQLRAEVTVASNLDRGLFVSDPVATGLDTRQLGGYVAILQDLGARVFAGARIDYYDPNLDALDARGGMLIPFNETITTVSPLLGARLPYRVRAAVQYDAVLDNLTRDARGVPADLANNRVIARLQVEL